MSWPDESTLRALLLLPGVSGQTLTIVEDYLEDPRLVHEMHEREAHMLAEEEANAEASGEDWNSDSVACEAHDMRRELCAAVNAHWA